MDKNGQIFLNNSSKLNWTMWDFIYGTDEFCLKTTLETPLIHIMAMWTSPINFIYFYIVLM